MLSESPGNQSKNQSIFLVTRPTLHESVKTQKAATRAASSFWNVAGNHPADVDARGLDHSNVAEESAEVRVHRADGLVDQLDQHHAGERVLHDLTGLGLECHRHPTVARALDGDRAAPPTTHMRHLLANTRHR
jgi:hypothetical protein